MNIRSKVIATVLIVAAALAAAFLYRDKAPQPVILQQQDSGSVLYLARNFQFVPAPLWKEMPASVLNSLVPTSLPAGFYDARFAFAKENSSCVFAYARLPKDPFPNLYRQTSFAGRVFTEGDQIDSSWYIHASATPPGFEFKWDGKQSLPGEVRIDIYPEGQGFDRPFALILYDAQGGIVSDDCIRDVDGMLSSLQRVFPVSDISSKSKGSLYLQSFNRGRINLTRLLFVPEGQESSQSVAEFSVASIPRPTVYKDAFYYVENGDLQKLDIFTRATSTIALTMPSSGDHLNDFYFHGDNLYYLAGADCTDYMARCSLSLYDQNLATGQNAFLAEGLSSRLILGVDETAAEIYLAHTDGDAGCFWAGTEIYSVIGGTMREGEDYSGCSGEEGNLPNPKLDAYRALLSRFSDESVLAQYARVDRGLVRAGDSKPGSVLPEGVAANSWSIRFMPAQ